MNRYFKELFDGFCEEEQDLIGNMIIRVGDTGLSFYSWSETLSEKEKGFVMNLAHKVDVELYGGLIEEDDDAVLRMYRDIVTQDSSFEAIEDAILKENNVLSLLD